jgi:hypothetical protein
MSREVLMICYLFPPAKSVGVLRLHKYYQSWKQQGHQVTVLSSSNRRRLPPEWLLVEERDILECPTWDYRRLLQWLKPNHHQHQSFGGKMGWWKMQARKLLVSLPSSLLLGEGAPLYCYHAYRKACQWATAGKEQWLFSSSSPLIDVIIASRVKKKFPHLHWIADFRDIPGDPALQDSLWPGMQRYFLKRILKGADRVIAVSQGQAKFFEALHPRVSVLMNGFVDQGVAPTPPSEKFTLTYTGSLYPGLQEVNTLVKLLEHWVQQKNIPVETLQIVYAGKDPGIFAAAFEGSVLKACLQLHGLLPLDQARALQRQSQVNVLLSWSQGASSGILSSKLFEYLSALKPMVALIKGPLDADFQQLQSDLEDHCFLSLEDPRCAQTFSAYLQTLYPSWQKGENLCCPLPRAYSWEAQFAKVFAQ